MTTPAIVPRLGCATTYTAYIHYWDRRVGGLRFYTQLTGISEVSWERVLDDFSECRIRFQPARGDDCCGKLKPIISPQGQVISPGVWPWAHELTLYRDGELVWQGPIFSVDELVMPDETTDHIQITARDFFGWLDRRTIHNDIFMNDRTYDLCDIAAAVVRDAFGPDDPGVLQHLVVRPSGKMGKRSIRHWENKAGDEIRDIARAGLDITSVGRAIIIQGAHRDETIPTRTLRTRDFQAGVEIRVVGAEAATVGVAVGGQPTQPEGSTTPIEDIPPAKVYWPPTGGTDPFFGLIENWTRSESVTNEDFLTWVAQGKVSDGKPPPTTLSVPADTGLNPDAPVSIHHLVPGTYFTLVISGTCRTLQQYMRLSHLKVSWSEHAPEAVGVTFIPQNIVDDSAVPV